MRLVLFALVFCALQISSPSYAECGWLGKLIGSCQLGDDAKDAVDKLNTQVQQTQEFLVRNTPGLSETAAINDLASSDPSVRKAAAARYRNLLAAAESLDNKDSEIQPYVLSVSYEFDDTKTFHIDKIRSADATEATARLWYDQGTIELSDATRPARMRQIPLNESQVRQTLVAKSDEFFEILGGDPALDREGPATPNVHPPEPCADRGCSVLTWPNFLFGQRYETWHPDWFPHFQQRGEEELKNNVITNQRNAAKEKLADLILSAYTYNQARVSSPDKTLAWPISDGNNHIIFYLDEESFNAQGEKDLTITFSVQLASDSNVTWNNRPVRTLKKSDFSPLKVKDGKTVYWAQREMSGTVLTPVGIAAVYKDRLDEIAALNQKLNAKTP